MHNQHTLDAELSVIGALLQAPSVAGACAPLSAEDFSEPALRRIYEGISAQLAAHEPVDLITIDSRLQTTLGAQEAKPLTDWMVRALQHTPTTANAHLYAQIVRDHSARRQLTGIAATLHASAGDARQAVSASVEQARQALRRVGDAPTPWVDMQAVLLDTFQNLEDTISGKHRPLRTGIEPLDGTLFHGLVPGELTLLGARPGVGKSAIAGHIALKAAAQGARVGIVSLEMSAVQYGQRLLGYQTRMDSQRIRRAEVSEEGLAAVAGAMPALARLPIEFLFECHTLEGLLDTVRRRMDSGGMQLLIIDYLQLLRLARGHVPDYERVSQISRSLKELSVTEGLPILALAQLSRAGAARQDKRPMLSDLRDSGALEQDADNVLLLHRPESGEEAGVDPRDRACFARAKHEGLHYLYLSVEKQRQGRTGYGHILFDPRTLHYQQIQR